VLFLLVSILAEEPESGLNAGNWGNDRAGYLTSMPSYIIL
jgi:hypothetical protein